ncbi:hypothetical protein PS1_023266 [Malus domestica]
MVGNPQVIHPCSESFKLGLLPIPKPIFTDPTSAQAEADREVAESPSHRVDSSAISEALQISIDQAKLILDTLALVLYSEPDLFVKAKPDGIDEARADVHGLVLFLYIQSYKKLLSHSPSSLSLSPILLVFHLVAVHFMNSGDYERKSVIGIFQTGSLGAGRDKGVRIFMLTGLKTKEHTGPAVATANEYL